MIPWVGGKQALCRAIISRFPADFRQRTYVEVFGFPDHMLLAEILLEIKARWLLSYNDCDTIRALYSVPGVYIEKIERINNLAQRYDPGNMYQELLISNYDTSLALPEQISLSGFAPVERNYIWK